MPIPIPDAWRKNYPHFIGDPQRLRIAYVFIVLIALLTFGVSCVYYYEYDKDTITKIVFDIETDPKWDCESIGIYNGPWELLHKTTIPANLSLQTDIGFIDLDEESIGSGTINSFDFNSYKLINDLTSQEDRNTFVVKHGNSPTFESCLGTFVDGVCAPQSLNTSQIIATKLYKFTYSISIDHSYPFPDGDSFEDHIQFDYLNLFKFNSSQDIFHSDGVGEINSFFLTFTESNEYWLVTDATDLCTNIEDGISNKEIEWGIYMRFGAGPEWNNNDLYYYPWDTVNSDMKQSPYNLFYANMTNISLNVQCEEMLYDYCIMNATHQFSFSDIGDLPRGSTMTVTDVQQKQYLLLSSQLGEECGDRWNYVCNEYYDINGLCNEMYIAPYTCTVVERKSFFGIVSLAFASSQLVNTILIVIFAFIYSKVSQTTWENDKAPWQPDIQAQLQKQLEENKESNVEMVNVNDEANNDDITNQ